MSIFFNNSSINDWNFGDDNIIKVYRNGAICYYKITSGDTPTPVQEPCFAVVDDITQYTDTEFEDVYDKATEKWYKLNNLNQYEEYGVYGSGRTITTYEGKLTIDEEITPSPSRLPTGYTEVEYIERNASHNGYVGLGEYFQANTRIQIDFQLTNTDGFAVVGDYFNNDNDDWRFFLGAHATSDKQVMYDFDRSRIKVALESNFLRYNWEVGNYYIKDLNTDNIIVSGTPHTNFSRPNQMYLFNLVGTIPQQNLDYGYIYSVKIWQNDVLVKEFVPCQRDSDNAVGLYDIVNDEFHNSSGGTMVAGSEVTPPPITATCEFIYSGGSWVNLGEVSGSSKTSGFTILDIEGSGTTSSFGDGDYIVISYFNHNDPKTPSSMMSYKTQSGHNYQNDFSGHTGSNTITDNTIIDAAVWKLEVTSTANTYYIKNIDTNEYFGYQNTNVNNSFYLVDSANKAPILIDDYNGGIGLIEMKQAVSSYYGGYGLNQLYGYTYRCNWLNGGSSSKANFYGNDGNALYVLYQVNDGGGLEYPVEYTVMQDPPDNLVFSSMAEAEAYECPWVGMRATIDGDKYVFSGDSQSGYEWVYNPSRLPFGYTEVEYIQNTSHAYLDIGFIPNQDSRIVCDMQQVTTNDFPRLWGAGEWDSANGINLNYEGGYLQISWFGKTSWTKFTSVPTNNDRHIYDLNKNNLYVDETLVGSNTYTTKTAAASIGIFCEIRNNGQPPTSGNNPKYWEGEYFKGKMYSFQVYNNGTLVRDLVPCIKDSDNTVGAYDIVNDVFYTVPTGYTTDKLVAGNPI